MRFRLDKADGGGPEPDGERSVPGHARLRGAGADTGVGCRRPRRPVRARLRAVRVSGRPASVRRDLGDGGHVGADARATCRAHGPQARASRRDRRGAGQGAGQGAGGAVRRLLRAGRGGAWSSRARRRGTAGVARAGVAASAREARRRHRGAARRRRGRRRGRPADARLRLRRHRLGGAQLGGRDRPGHERDRGPDPCRSQPHEHRLRGRRGLGAERRRPDDLTDRSRDEGRAAVRHQPHGHRRRRRRGGPVGAERRRPR